MRNLPLPSRDSDRENLQTAIRQYKYRGQERGHNITEEEIDAVVALYEKYEADLGKACEELKGADLPQALRDNIHAAYNKTQVRGALYRMRELLFKDVHFCPLCGIDPATELDHHLPRSVFKPLAIYSRNLVPMCHRCNHAKLAGFDVDGSGFLHPYYEALPDILFLQASIALTDGALVVTFAIAIEAALPEGYRDRLTRQMEVLNLGDRYQQEVNTYITGYAAALHMNYRRGGQPSVRDMLRLQANFDTMALHRNHWRPTLLRGLLAHDGFTGGGFAEVLPIDDAMLLDLEGGP